MAQNYADEKDTDLYLLSGPINEESSDGFIDLITGKKKLRSSAGLFVTTYGGQADAAFRMARCLMRHYKANVRVFLTGPCKSAGTLFALASSELVFSEKGELGPLDVQLTKPNEIIPSSSGLDIFQALELLSGHAFDKFEECMLSISHRSGGSVRIKTASEIAVQLVASWLNPIAEQIDPLRLGEAQRAIAIAKEYGVRIGSKNLNPGALDTLVEGYPSHSFVIDQEEADKLFKNVRSIEEKELEIAEGLSPHTHDPSKEPIVLSLDESGHEKGGDAHEGASDRGGTPDLEAPVEEKH